MTEAEVLFQLTYQQERFYAELQWIASISFGLVAIAHWRPKLLSVPILVTLIVLYGAFAVIHLGSQAMRFEEMSGLNEILAQLQADGGLSAAGQGRLAAQERWLPLVSAATSIVVVGVLVGTVSFLTQSFVRTRRKS